MDIFPKRLKMLRESKGILQKELANSLGLSQSTIGMYERGLRQPDHETLFKISDFFNVSIDYLLGRFDVPEPTPREQLEALLRSPEFRDTTVAFQDYEEWTDEEIQSIIEYIEGKRLLKESKKK